MQHLGSEERRVRVLLIEDNDGDVYLISLALDSAAFPHSLTVLRDGADAVTFIREAMLAGAQALPELVLLDLNLPKVDGATLVEMFRAEPALSGIPIMLLSSSRSPEDCALARKFSKCTFSFKPSDLSSFMMIGVQAKDFWMQAG